MVTELLALLLALGMAGGTAPPAPPAEMQAAAPSLEHCIALLRSGTLDPALEQARTQLLESGDATLRDRLVQQHAPGLELRILGESNAIGLNVTHFLSRIRKGSPEHRFFTLALQGFYLDQETDRLGTAHFPAWIARTHSSAQGTVNRIAAQRYRARWKALRPQLTGLQRELADATLHHLTRLVQTQP